jgi:hypothetical protein
MYRFMYRIYITAILELVRNPQIEIYFKNFSQIPLKNRPLVVNFFSITPRTDEKKQSKIENYFKKNKSFTYRWVK